jgi:hypothetical protein
MRTHIPTDEVKEVLLFPQFHHTVSSVPGLWTSPQTLNSWATNTPLSPEWLTSGTALNSASRAKPSTGVNWTNRYVRVPSIRPGLELVR